MPSSNFIELKILFMKTIIVAIDYSPAALNAAQYATNMALGINANLFLLHVFQTPIIYSKVPLALSDESIIHVAANEEHIKDEADKNLMKLKDELIMKTGGKINVDAEMRFGVFFGELKNVCKKIQPYAVIMGSQGTTSAERFVFGGHAIFAMTHLKWPLITVPLNAKYSFIKKVALACDFDGAIDITPFDEIELLVKDLDAELNVVNTGVNESVDEKVSAEVDLIKEKLASLNPAYHFITSEDTDEAIMDFAETNNIDLLIVLPKKHDFFEKLMHRSHTKQFVLHSHIPVMALHQ